MDIKDNDTILVCLSLEISGDIKDVMQRYPLIEALTDTLIDVIPEALLGDGYSGPFR